MPPITVNISNSPVQESRLRNVSLSRTFSLPLRKLKDLKEKVISEEFLTNYGNTKRRRIIDEIKDIKDELDGIPLMIEYKTWWNNNDFGFCNKSLLPGNKRFPWKITIKNLVVGSWVVHNGVMHVVTGVEFIFRNKNRVCFVHIQDKLLTRVGTKAFSKTVPLREITRTDIQLRLSFHSVRQPLIRFIRILKEHCLYKPGGLGYLQAQTDFYS